MKLKDLLNEQQGMIHENLIGVLAMKKAADNFARSVGSSNSSTAEPDTTTEDFLKQVGASGVEIENMAVDKILPVAQKNLEEVVKNLRSKGKSGRFNPHAAADEVEKVAKDLKSRVIPIVDSKLSALAKDLKQGPIAKLFRKQISKEQLVDEIVKIIDVDDFVKTIETDAVNNTMD